MIFSKRLAAPGQLREMTIEHSVNAGWIAREQNDGMIRTSVIRDWRHVEATIALFELRTSILRSEGWAEV